MYISAVRLAYPLLNSHTYVLLCQFESHFSPIWSLLDIFRSSLSFKDNLLQSGHFVSLSLKN